MSHIVTIATKIHDPAAVASACRRLNLAEPVQGTARLYSGEATGLLVGLPTNASCLLRQRVCRGAVARSTVTSVWPTTSA